MVFICKRMEAWQCEVKSPRSLCFDKWQKLNSKSFLVLPNITWKFPSLFFYGSRIFSLLELICRINGRNIVKKNLFWCEDCDSRIFFFSYNDKACGFDNKKCRIYKLTEQGHLCEFSGGSTWNCGDSLTPRIFFESVGNSEGQYGLDKLALKKVCLVFFDHRFFGRWLQLRGLYSSLWNISSRQKNQLVV